MENKQPPTESIGERLRNSSLNTSRLTPEGTALIIEALAEAYPSLHPGFYDILLSRLKAKRFSDSEFRYAVYQVFDTCTYPIPTIAHIINYDPERSMPDRSE